MDGDGPGDPERILLETSHHIGLDLAVLAKSVLHVFPLYRAHPYRLTVSTFNLYGSIDIDGTHLAKLAIIVLPLGIIPDEHDLCTLLERKHMIGRIDILREFTIHISLKHMEFIRQFVQLHGIHTICLGIVCCQTDGLAIILVGMKS